MAKFPMDLSKFKKVGGDKHTTVMRHEDGHEMRIAHAALKPEMRKAFEALPVAMADGGQMGSTANLKENYSGAKKKSNKIQHFDGGGDVKSDSSDQSSSGDATPASPTQDGISQDQQTSAPAAQPAAAPAPVVVNVNGAGAAPQQASAPAPAPQANNFTQGPGGPVFDFNKAALNSPNAPIEAKTRALEAMNAQAEQDKQNQAASGQSDRDKILAYNVQAQKAGLPPLPVPADTAAGPAPAAEAAPAAQAGGTQPQAPGQDAFGTQAYQENYLKGLNEQKQGLQGEALATGAQGKAEAAALQQSINNQQANLKTFKDNFGALDNERKAFMNDIQNQHIDPQRYMSNMGVGQKIVTAIGLILGGQDAHSYVQKQIDQDIDAQKSELGKKENLLSANMKQFGNLKDATEMTRVMQMDVIGNQLKMEAAKAMDPIAKARALQAAGKLDQEAAPLLSQIAMRRTLLSGMASGTMDPARVVNLMIPENQRGEANKELKEAQTMAATRDNLVSAFDQLAKINTVGNAVSSPLQTSKQVQAIKGPLLAALSKETAGRFTDSDAQMLDGLFPAKGDSPETQAMKREQMLKMVNEKMHFPILETYGISANHLGRFNNSGGAARIQEAPRVMPGKK